MLKLNLRSNRNNMLYIELQPTKEIPMAEISTNCRTEEGITVGLVDALISICRVLAPRDLDNAAVQEALKDMFRDEDYDFVRMKASVADRKDFNEKN